MQSCDMPIYKFHVLNDTFYAVDDVGIELPDDNAVDRHAREAIAGLVGDEFIKGKEPIHLVIMVDDETGRRVADYRSVMSLVVG
jgi:hypothetical protein